MENIDKKNLILEGLTKLKKNLFYLRFETPSLLFLQTAILPFSLFLLNSCSSPSCRQWEIQVVRTQSPCFNGGRIVLEPDGDCSYLELEIFRNSWGIRIYLNLLLLQAPPLQNDPSRTSTIIQFEGNEPWIVYPYLLEGGQKLLFPADISDQLIQAILDENDFSIQTGRYKIDVISTNFKKVFQELLDLPVEEIENAQKA